MMLHLPSKVNLINCNKSNDQPSSASFVLLSLSQINVSEKRQRKEKETPSYIFKNVFDLG